MFLRFPFTAVLIFLICQLSLAQVEPTAKITGQILSNENTPIVNATVRLGARTASSDQQGKFELSVVPGHYRLEVIAAEYTLESRDIEVSGDTEISFHLQPAIVVTVHPQPEALEP